MLCGCGVAHGLLLPQRPLHHLVGVEQEQEQDQVGDSNTGHEHRHTDYQEPHLTANAVCRTGKPQ